MHKYKIILSGQERILAFKAKLFSSKHQVLLDGEKIGEFQNAKEAKEGKDFVLNDHNTANIKYITSFMTPEIHIKINGETLEDSAGHPSYKKKNALVVILLLFSLNFLAGIAAIIWAPANEMGIGIYNIILGLLYLVGLGLFKFSHPFIGILLVIILYGIDTGFLIYSVAQNPGAIGAFVVRFIFFAALFKALFATWPNFKGIFVND